jgi:hypothetical protein
MYTAKYSRSQANVIYRAVKEGKLNLDSNTIRLMYLDADCQHVELVNPEAINDTVQAIFASDYESAQKWAVAISK